jgi:hypothetical protein
MMSRQIAKAAPVQVGLLPSNGHYREIAKVVRVQEGMVELLTDSGKKRVKVADEYKVGEHVLVPGLHPSQKDNYGPYCTARIEKSPLPCCQVGVKGTMSVNELAEMEKAVAEYEPGRMRTRLTCGFCYLEYKEAKENQIKAAALNKYKEVVRLALTAKLDEWLRCRQALAEAGIELLELPKLDDESCDVFESALQCYKEINKQVPRSYQQLLLDPEYIGRPLTLNAERSFTVQTKISVVCKLLTVEQAKELLTELKTRWDSRPHKRVWDDRS